MPKEKNVYVRKYRVAWESDAELKGWIGACSDSTKAFCKTCKCILSAHKKDLLNHGKSQKHKEAGRLSLAGPSKKITEFMKKSISTSRKICELKISAFICEHCSLKTADHLGTLIKNLDPNSEVLTDVKLHRTKCTALILNVIAPCLLNDLILDIGDGRFSMIIDESTAVDCTKMLCVMVKYFSKNAKKVITTFYRLIEIESGDAVHISTAISKQVKTDNLNLENLIGIGVDGANVMVGQNNSLSTFLKSINNEIVVVKCICHSLHLAAEYAFKQLPRHLDFIIKECNNWFSCSTKRQIAYCKIYETLSDKKPLKIDKLSGTRWLARYNAIVKITEQWDALRIHFGIAKESERCYVADQLYQMLSDKSNFVYFTFLSWSLNQIVQVNKLFQSDSADPLKLMEDLNLLLLNNLGVLLPPVRLQTERTARNDLTSFNFEDFIMNTDLMNFGYSFNEAAVSIDKKDLSVIRTRCKDFLVELCRQIQKRIPANMELLQNLNSLTPELATSLIRQPDITNLSSSFLTLCKDVDATISEWKTLPRVNWYNLQNTEAFWVEVGENVNSAGEHRFKHISQLALGLLSLPFSNASVERAFSIINIVKNKLRNRLAISSTDAIMRTRWHIFSLRGGCTSFEPDEKMLKMFNSENVYNLKNEDEENVMELFSNT